MNAVSIGRPLSLAAGFLATFAAVSAVGAAAGRTIVLQDPTGRGFAPDLVNDTIAAPADGGAGLRVLDADGKPVPLQVTPGEKGKATLSFVATVRVADRAPFARVTEAYDLGVAAISWRNEPGSDVSPFSCHEHDPALPVTYGRRVWGLVLAHPAIVVEPTAGSGSTCLGYSVRNLYGTVGLDRYKDFALDWKDGGVTYPRVFIAPGELEKYLAAVKADPTFALATYDNKKNPVGLGNYYLFTKDPAVAQAEVSAKEPRLTSRVYPGFGVVFRAHQGPDETYLALRSGYHWSHWNQDQGNLVCYSKGAALLPPQPYQVKIAEWEWPAMPPAPVRAALDLE